HRLHRLSLHDALPISGQRESWDELLIRPRLLAALRRLNPEVPEQYLQQACAEITAPSSQDAITENHRIHKMYVEGYRITYLDAEDRKSTRLNSSHVSI